MGRISNERIKEILIENRIDEFNIMFIDYQNVILSPELGKPCYEFYAKVYDVVYELRRESFHGIVTWNFNGLSHIIST